MNHPTTWIGGALIFSLGLAAGGVLHQDQEKKQDAKPQEKPGKHEAGMMGDMPKPGPEHAWLAKAVGTWNAKSKFQMGPGQPPMEGEATSVDSMVGGFWLVQKYDDKVPGPMGEFHGMGITGYDTHKKKFVIAWVDSMGSNMWTGEGSLDKAGKVLTFEVSGFDPMTNKDSKATWTTTFVDDKHTTFTIDGEFPDGTKGRIGEINYTR